MAVVFERPQDLIGQEGRDLGVSSWAVVDQARIDGFAEVTGDRQWIHVDPERARSGPFGAAIAHGYLTLALVNLFLPELIEVRGVSMGVNVGCDSVRFLSPVRAGSRIRGRGELLRAGPAKGGAVQAVVRVTVEIENETAPACVVDTVSRYYPEEGPPF